MYTLVLINTVWLKSCFLPGYKSSFALYCTHQPHGSYFCSSLDHKKKIPKSDSLCSRSDLKRLLKVAKATNERLDSFECTRAARTVFSIGDWNESDFVISQCKYSLAHFLLLLQSAAVFWLNKKRLPRRRSVTSSLGSLGTNYIWLWIKSTYKINCVKSRPSFGSICTTSRPAGLHRIWIYQVQRTQGFKI